MYSQPPYALAALLVETLSDNNPVVCLFSGLGIEVEAGLRKGLSVLAIESSDYLVRHSFSMV